jgi:hypothetical protein
MLNKKLLPAAVATTLLAGAASSWAEDRVIVEGDSMPFEISANVTLTSDYRFRGISQSDESAAIQGGFDAEFAAGFYVGVWGSTVDFDVNQNVVYDDAGNPVIDEDTGEVVLTGSGYDGSLELDYYAGWASDLGDSGLGIDVGILYYDYPGDDDDEGDYWEVYGSMSWNDLAVGVHYSDDYYAETDEFWYIYADYGFTLFADIGLGLHVGYNILEEDGGFLSSDEDAYFDYSVSLSKEWAGVEWALAWVGTDLDDDDVFGTDWADDTVVFSISKSM